MPNIWSIDDDQHGDDASGQVVTSAAEDELERPSFLRRLKKRRLESDDDSDKSTPDK